MAHSPVRFSSDARDQYDQKMFLALTSWNFGDGVTAKGTSMAHTYARPGQYVVVARVTRGADAITLKKTISVIGGVISVTQSSTDGITVGNTGNSEVNLSGWSIRSGTDVFVFPYNTFLEPNQSLFISKNTLGFVPGAVSLLVYPSGKSVTVHTDSQTMGNITSNTNMSRSTTNQKSFIQQPETSHNISGGQNAAVFSAVSGGGASSSGESTNHTLEWSLALGGLIIVGGASAFWARRNKSVDE